MVDSGWGLAIRIQFPDSQDCGLIETGEIVSRGEIHVRCAAFLVSGGKRRSGRGNELDSAGCRQIADVQC